MHQVREAKELTKHHEDLEFVSGIVVESLAYAAAGRELPDKVAIALFLDHAKEAVKRPVLEPAGEDNVTAKWTAEERETAARMYAQASRNAGRGAGPRARWRHGCRHRRVALAVRRRVPSRPASIGT